MAKITRYDGNLVPFGINATGTNRTIFGSVSQSDDLTANIDNGSYKLGWEIVGPSDKPTIQDFSGATFTNAQLSAYLHQMGVAEWNDRQEYQIGSIANRAGALYSCLTADHVSATPPESDAVNWKSAAPADLLNTTRINVASAATVDLTSNAPNTRHINITGSNSISAFTVASGQCYFVRFDATATIVNSASIVTQSGANIVAGSGDTCVIRATSSNTVEIICYTRAQYDPIGVGQTWQDVIGSRSAGVIYTNTTGKPIQLAISINPSTAVHNVLVGGVIVAITTNNPDSSSIKNHVFAIVPDGDTYSVESGAIIDSWAELR